RHAVDAAHVLQAEAARERVRAAEDVGRDRLGHEEAREDLGAEPAVVVLPGVRLAGLDLREEVLERLDLLLRDVVVEDVRREAAHAVDDLLEVLDLRGDALDALVAGDGVELGAETLLLLEDRGAVVLELLDHLRAAGQEARELVLLGLVVLLALDLEGDLARVALGEGDLGAEPLEGRAVLLLEALPLLDQVDDDLTARAVLHL